MILKVYNSKMDKFGNCYWAIELLNDDHSIVKDGIISANNIDTIDCRENLSIKVIYQELPIREFNKRFKNSLYLGCRWEEIKSHLIEDIFEIVRN